MKQSDIFIWAVLLIAPVGLAISTDCLSNASKSERRIGRRSVRSLSKTGSFHMRR